MDGYPQKFTSDPTAQRGAAMQRRNVSCLHYRDKAMKKCIIDYSTKTGPLRAYGSRPAGRMPRGGKRGRVRGYSPGARRHLIREIHRLAARWEKLRPIFITLTLPGKDWEQIEHKAAFKRWRARLCTFIPGVWGAGKVSWPSPHEEGRR